MTEVMQTVKEIDALTCMLAGATLGKSRDKEKAATRFSMYARQQGIAEDLLGMKFEEAKNRLKVIVASIEQKEERLAAEMKAQLPKGKSPADKGIEAAKADDAAIAKERTAAGSGFTLTSAEINGLITLGGGKWRGEKDGVVIEVARKDGMFTTKLSRDGVSVEGQPMKGYASSVRSAIAAFNGEGV